MKAWIRKVITSAQLDKPASGLPSEPDAELLHLHRELVSSRPGVPHTQDLHSSIMAAVRAEARLASCRDTSHSTAELRPPVGFKFATATVCCGIAALALAVFLQYQSQSDTRADAIGALNSTIVAATDAPAKINPLLPLETELSLLTRDIESTAKALRATAPL